jgi:hypothetical protein
MEIVYKKNIYEQLDKIIDDANKENKSIDTIYLTKEEYGECKSLGKNYFEDKLYPIEDIDSFIDINKCYILDGKNKYRFVYRGIPIRCEEDESDSFTIRGCTGGLDED